MKKIYIIQRWEGTPYDDWRPWLKSELEKYGFEVFIPDMPNTETPVIEDWVSYLFDIITNPDENTFFVGHSIGCQTILRYLEKIKVKIGGAVFVAPWFKLDNLEDDEVKEIARPWVENPIDFKIIKQNTNSFISFLSSNEPYGYIEENKKILEGELGSQVVVLENRGHFTEDDDQKELPEVISGMLESILRTEFPIVYEWYDEPNTEYDEHEHKGRVSFYVLEGEVRFTSGISATVSKYQRIDVPIGLKHTAVVGGEGCLYIVGQEIENDA